jgi:2-oxoisovalerate dehydrogenase E1 component
MSFRLQRLDRVAVSFFGEGASNAGTFQEGLNLAAVQDAPVIFVCENNLFATSTHITLTTRIANIAEREAAYSMPESWSTEWMSRRFMPRPERRWRAPVPVRGAHRGQNHRYRGHSHGDPGGYRRKDEHAAWTAQDPIDRLRRRLTGDFAVPAASLAESRPPPKLGSRQRSSLPGEVGNRAWSRCSHECAGQTWLSMGMAETLGDALRIAMRDDPPVFLLGEDIGVPGGFGGGFTVTLGLAEEFGRDRVIGYTDLRERDRRRGNGGGDGREQAGSRDAIRRLRLLRNGPGR